MNDLLKAQLTVGFLACFATVWGLIFNGGYDNLFIAAGLIITQLGMMLILSYVIISILEWINVFDLKTNAILTLFVLIGIVLGSNTTMFLN